MRRRIKHQRFSPLLFRQKFSNHHRCFESLAFGVTSRILSAIELGFSGKLYKDAFKQAAAVTLTSRHVFCDSAESFLPSLPKSFTDAPALRRSLMDMMACQLYARIFKIYSEWRYKDLRGSRGETADWEKIHNTNTAVSWNAKLAEAASVAAGSKFMTSGCILP